MHWSAAEIVSLVASWMFPFMRISAFAAAAPTFSNRTVPVRVRLGFAVALTVVIAPMAPPMPSIDPISPAAVLVAAQQVLIGLALGFSVRLLFVALEVAGQQIAQLMGLGFASLVDPQNGIDVPVVSNFYILLATLVFLGLDGHLALIALLARSFHTLPIGPVGLGPRDLWSLSVGAGWVLSAALLIVLPAVAALFTANLAFGVMSRAAPQLNIFAVGFPVMLLLGFVVMLLTLPSSIGSLDDLVRHALGVAADLMHAGG
jgi:flagellar biosynthetic protein FliR